MYYSNCYHYTFSILMLKNRTNALGQKIQWLSLFDKWNVVIIFAFFIVALVFPISYISPLTTESQTQTIRMISLEYRKTSILILVILAINIWISINSNFKSRFLRYTGIGNDIYARFFQKWIIFIMLIFFWEIILHLRNNLTQTINLAMWYYILWWLLIAWIIIDFLFLQRNYKVQSAHENSKLTIIREENNNEWKQSFKNLFDE